MKKYITYMFLTVSLISCLFLPVQAFSDAEPEKIKEEISNELESSIDSDIREKLKDMGLEDFEPESIFNVSLDSISKFFSDTLKEKLVNNSKLFFELLGVILLAGIILSILTDDDKSDFLEIIVMIVVVLSSVRAVSVTLPAVISALEASKKFMLSFVPVYTLIVSFGGNPSGALTYNTLVLGFAEIVSALITTNITNFMGVFFCLGISFSFNSSINISRIISGVNKIFSTIIGFAASVFTGFLSLKSILSVSIDSVSVKGIRFLISSMIPIIGSSISEAYSSLIGSINLIKGSVAIVGILVIIIINIPIIFDVLTYYIIFNLISYVADSLAVKRAADALKCFSSGMRILLLVCIFEMFIVIISTGILLSVKNGG